MSDGTLPLIMAKLDWISIFNADQALLDELLLEELAC
jgi:hypothetical protein